MTQQVASVPLREVVTAPGLALQVVDGSARPGALDLPVCWAHVSELRDPAPYLLGGELLLTAGVNMSAADDLGDYVAGLLAAGVTALGFGLTPPMHDRLPEPLRDACVDQGLPLLVVPRRTPFLAISRTVAVAVAEAAQREQRRLAVAREALARAAQGGLAALVRELADRVDGWAALVGAHDERVAAHRAPAAWPPAELPDLFARLRAGRGRRSATTALADGTSVLAQPVSPQAAGSRLLVVGRRDRFGETDRAVVAAATTLLGLVGGAGPASTALAGATTGLLLGALPRGAALARLLPGTGYRVVAGAPRRRSRPGGPTDHAWLVERLGTPLVDLTGDGGFTAVVTERPSRDALAAVHGQGWVPVVSRHCDADALPRAAGEVTDLLARGLALDRPVVAEDADLGLSTAVRPEAAAAFAADVLAPLRRADAQGGLVEVLRTWLAHHGGWEATATALGIHRNSVRHRIAQVERALGVDLADPEVRMQLWFALRWADIGSS
ncbi:PucR family transcriptional regulator [Saccharopolyspora rosea]